RSIDFENLEGLIAQIAEGVSGSRRDVDHVVLADRVGLAFDDERPLAPLDDIDIVRIRMVMKLAARPPGGEPVEMKVDLFGTEGGIDELDLLAAASFHRVGRASIEVKDLEQRFHSLARVIRQSLQHS